MSKAGVFYKCVAQANNRKMEEGLVEKMRDRPTTNPPLDGSLKQQSNRLSSQ